MGWLSRFLKSNMGMKAIMALSGLMLVGFVVIHSLGNLQIFLGKDTLNHYGEMLQGNQEVMWILRSGLILAFLPSAPVLRDRCPTKCTSGCQRAIQREPCAGAA
jgi:hypothetical protein